ncbi:hypothetical protein CVS40_12508 [Lucilia cuprina]|nr:hypothetical protein CVS40_12508 [Lucilia cuprina]
MHDYAQNSKQLFWNRKMLEMFIDLYRENACLYDKRHQDYNNKTIKANVLKSMLTQMRKFLPTLELVDIQDKIKVIRAQFSEEVTFADAAGAGYVPQLWCFEKLQFLREHLTCWPTDDTDSNEENTIAEENHSENSDNESDDFHLYLTTILDKYKSETKYRWDPVVTKIFINVLEGYQILLDPNYSDFKHRVLRRKALCKLQKEMKKVDPKINIKHVYDKIVHLRRCYLNELDRLKKKRTNNNEKLTSKWWCFDMLTKLYKDRYGVNSNSNLKEVSVENDNQIGYNMSSKQQAKENSNNDHIELLEFEEVQQVFDGDQEMETKNTQNTMEYECVNISMSDESENIKPTTTSCINEEYCDYDETDLNVTNMVEYECANTSITDDTKNIKLPTTNSIDSDNITEFKVTEISAINKYSPKSKNKAINVKTDMIGVSLGNLVATKLKEISPKYHADFAWDVQCLVRKYILKSREQTTEETSSASIFVNNKQKPTVINVSFV